MLQGARVRERLFALLPQQCLIPVCSLQQAALHKHGCYPWRTLVAPFAQFPMLMLGMMGVRHMVFMGDESFEQEGLLWFPDLTVVDQTYALQVIAFSLTYLASEVCLPCTWWLPASAHAVAFADCLPALCREGCRLLLHHAPMAGGQIEERITDVYSI